MGPAALIADALGVILTRGFRNGLYQGITAGIADGLSEATYPVLSALARAGKPTSAAVLSSVIGLDRSVVSRRATALIHAGLLVQDNSPDDRRQTLLTLTPDGVRAVSEARCRLNLAVTQHLSSWTAAEQETLASLLARFTENPLELKRVS